MTEIDPHDLDKVLGWIRAQAKAERFRVTRHAHEEMVEEDITLDQVVEAMASGEILENYPQHRRGACGLLGGRTKSGRPLHIVCTTTTPLLIIITAYEPKLPKWVSPTQRRPAR